MKAKFSLLAAACIVGLAPALLAVDATTKTADKKDAAKVETTKAAPDKKATEPARKTVMLTGSNLPQTVTQVGRITDSAQPVTVLSHDDLERTGENNLGAALRKSMPAFH
jgi:hypothetical protein